MLHVQVQDYGVTLKCDGGNQVMAAQFRLFHLFLIIDNSKCKEYQRAMCTSIHLWMWMMKNKHPSWKIFKNNASAFNEESGEICFSVLAREIAGSGVRSDCSAVSSKFKLIKSKTQIAKDLKVELCGEDFSTKHHSSVKKDSAEVFTTIAFFQRMIRQVKAKTYRHYDSTCGHLDQKARRRKDARVTVPMSMVSHMSSDVGKRLDKVVSNMKDTFDTFWVHQHSDIWPQGMPSHKLSDSEDEQKSIVRGNPQLSGVNGGGLQKKNKTKRGKKRRMVQRESARGSSSDESPADIFLGRVVSVPSWCLGLQWSLQAYGSVSARNKARLHGRLEQCSKPGTWNCRFWHDTNYLLNLTRAQVESFLVAHQDEEKVKDTPFITDDCDGD